MTDRHVPPYDELRDANTGDGADGVRKAFDADNAGPSGPGAPVSAQERSGMSSTEMDPQPQHGVGERRLSSGEEQAPDRGEEQAPDRGDVGTKGRADRPVGRAAEDDAGSVATSGSVTPGSPDLQAGDQGG